MKSASAQHRDEHEARSAHRRAVEAYQRRHLDAGLCMLCPREAVSAHYCDHHRRSVNARRLHVTERTSRCGLCGGTGRNRRTCPAERVPPRRGTRAARTR